MSARQRLSLPGLGQRFMDLEYVHFFPLPLDLSTLTSSCEVTRPSLGVQDWEPLGPSCPGFQWS